jgi:AcrR family transcriptional regulator
VADRELEPQGPLPRGRHGLTAEEVATHQRERIVDAIATTVARHGYGGLTVERVIEAAGVSRSTFYVHFEGKRDAMLAAHESIFERFTVALAGSCERSGWPAKIRQAIATALGFAIARPEHFQILFPGPTSADLAERISSSYDRLADLLGGVRSDSPYGTKLPASTELFLIVGGASTINSWIVAGKEEERSFLQQQLVELLLLPYYGRARAARLSRAKR